MAESKSPGAAGVGAAAEITVSSYEYYEEEEDEEAEAAEEEDEETMDKLKLAAMIKELDSVDLNTVDVDLIKKAEAAIS